MSAWEGDSGKISILYGQIRVNMLLNNNKKNNRMMLEVLGGWMGLRTDPAFDLVESITKSRVLV